MEQGLKLANEILKRIDNVESIKKEEGYDYVFTVTLKDGGELVAQFNESFELDFLFDGVSVFLASELI